jgi:hypothetical protein
MDLQFEWDEAKATANERKHDVSMSKESPKQQMDDDGMLLEYDFSGGVRGKHHKAYQSGYQVTILKEDGTTELRDFALPEGTVVLDPDVRA